MFVQYIAIYQFNITRQVVAVLDQSTSIAPCLIFLDFGYSQYLLDLIYYVILGDIS